MKKLFLFLLTAAIVALLVFRFIQERQIAATETIETIQTKDGYPVQVTKVELGSFKQVKRYTGTVVGGSETYVMAMIGEYIESVNVSQGQKVTEGDVICELSKDNPSANYQPAKLAFDNAGKELDRVKALFNEGAVSQQLLDQVTLQHNLAREMLTTSENLLTVTAPISGTITELNAEPGQFTAPGMPLAMIVSGSKLRVKINIPSDDRELIPNGATCELSSAGVRMAGNIDRIALSADPKMRGFTGWINLNERSVNKRFSPGLLVDVAVNVVDVNGIVTLELDALNRSGDEWYVYVINGDKANRIPIELSDQNSTIAWVKSGLNVGDVAVVSGADLLFDNAPIRIIEGVQ